MEVISRLAPFREDAFLSVISFNILAPCYVRVPDQPWNAFGHCSDEVIDPSNRFPSIVTFLSDCNADVICLQEVMFEKHDENWDIPTWLSDPLSARGYHAIMQGLTQKQWSKNAERNGQTVGRPVPTGLVTFYKRELWHEARPSKHGAGSGIVIFLTPSIHTDQSERRCKEVVVVANVHLTGSPSKMDAQIMQLQGMKKNIGPDMDKCVIVCGDFNNEVAAGTELSQWVTSIGLEDLPCGETWAEPNHGSPLDHILFNPTKLLPVLRYETMFPQDREEGLPNTRWPSDHLPVGAAFVLRSGTAQASEEKG